MKAVLLTVAIVFAAGLASAEEFYSQPLGDEMNYINVTSAYEVEAADDIPEGFAGTDITAVTLYVRQWGAQPSEPFVEPSALNIHFYDGACPPAMESAASFSFPWSDVEAEFMETWWDASSFQNYLYAVELALPEAVTITEAMSLGVTIDVDWGTDAPYTGVNGTDTEDVSGCGPAYLDGHFDVPRWTPISDTFLTVCDLAYTLHNEPVAVEPQSWGAVKSLFR